jgi:O-antigen/teichoic acid export membrane protein
MRRYAERMRAFRSIGIAGIFFRNTNHRQTVLKNTFWLGLGQGLSGLFNFLLIIFIIRKLGATEYGKFAYALAFVSLFSTLFDFGLAMTVTRDFARDQGKERHLLDLLILKTILGTFFTVVIIVLAYFTAPDEDVRTSIFLLIFYIFASELINLFYAFFRARQKMEIEATFRTLQIVLQTIIILALVFTNVTVFSLCYAYVGGAVAALAGILFYLIWKEHAFIPRKLSFNTQVWREFLVVGVYLAFARGAGDVTHFADSVMLGHWGSVEAVGWYNGASKINATVLIPMALVSTAIFPTLVTVLKESKEKFTSYWESWVKLSLFFSCLPCFMVLAKANQIITVAYSSRFLPAAGALKIIIFVAAIAWVSSAYYHILLILEQQKKILVVVTVGALINVALNVILIPRFSLYGAAIAAVATHAAILCQFLLTTWKYAFVRLASPALLLTLFVCAVSGGAMYSFLSLANINLWASLVCGSALYGVCLLIFNKLACHFVGILSSFVNLKSRRDVLRHDKRYSTTVPRT